MRISSEVAKVAKKFISLYKGQYKSEIIYLINEKPMLKITIYEKKFPIVRIFEYPYDEELIEFLERKIQEREGRGRK